MIYPYEVKYNGEFYPAGADVPVGNPSITETLSKEESYTRTDINRMNKAELVSLADSVGIEDASEKSGSELKELLLEHFEL